MINVSNGGKDLIEDSEIMLSFGRRYGIVGRNGTGKTTFLRALATYEIKGLPANCQVLHVEQEIVGNNTTVLQVCCHVGTSAFVFEIYFDILGIL